MKKLIPLIFMLVFLPTVLGQVGIYLPTQTVILHSGKTSTFSILIRNNETTDETFAVSIYPPQYTDISTSIYPQIVYVPSNSEKNITISFTASKGVKPKPFLFNLTVKSIVNPSVSFSKSISVIVLRSSPVYISDFYLNKYTFDPNEKVEISTKLTNVIDQLSPMYNLKIEIYYQNKIIKTFELTTDNVPADSSLQINKTYKLNRYAPNGTYKVKVTLSNLAGNYIDSAEKEFSVRAVYKLPEEYTKKETTWTLLSTKTKITVKNEGNIPTPEFYVKEQMPIFMKDFFEPEVKPTAVEVSGSTVTYKWLIPSLKPGQSVVISYRISLWGAWLGLIVIAGMVYFFFKLSFKPTVAKKHGIYGKIREKEIPIIIEIKNKSRSAMNNVTVQDFIPLMTKVMPRFETLKPKVKKSRKGEELTWKFDSIEAGEERVILYYLKPIVELTGELTLPPVKVTYYDENKNKRILISNELILKQ